ncbi:hypothetical protein [Marinoscillum sp.]|uniref:hypothetical protein n=1 Tax=Marinoscillum sp. TaxID=2024838 RepID=UPI003BABDE70
MSQSDGTKTLKYIEDTPKDHGQLVKAAVRGVSRAIASAKEARLYITCAKGPEIVREHPNGKIEVIGRLNNSPATIGQDTKLILD